jgi:hypothetical protein
MKIDKNFWPIIAGLIAMFFWAMMLCIVSVCYGPLGHCAGIHIGHYTIGNVSRYCDPFLLGVLVAFAVFAWQHQPPSFSWNKAGKLGNKIPISEQIWIGFVVSFVLFLLSLPFRSYFGYPNIPLVFLCYGIMLLAPFGWRGVIIPVAVVTLIFCLTHGLPFAMIFFFAVWLGKWAIWWFWNIIRLGFRDTYLKVTRQVSPDHSNEGTDIPQELSL